MSSLLAPATRVLLLSVVAIGTGVAAITWAEVAPWSGGDYKLTVMMPTSGSLAERAGVRINGVEVGRVSHIERRGDVAQVEVGISDAKVPLPEDTRATLRLRTLVGESYIELKPGTSRQTLESGARLPLVTEESFVESDRVLSVLQGKARDDARKVIQRLGRGLEGQSPKLNAFLQHASGAVRNATDVVAVLDQDRRQVRAVVRSVGELTAEIADREAAIKAAARNGGRTFAALADRSDALGHVLDELPSTLSSVRTATRTLQDVSGAVAPEVTDLGRAITALRPAVRQLAPAAKAGEDLLAQLAKTGPRLTPTLKGARELSGPTVRAVPQLGRLLCEVNPMLRYLAPYEREAAAIVHNMGSATSFYDASGHAARLYAQVGQMSVAAIGSESKTALDQLVTRGVLQESNPQGYNPYPKPGMLGKDPKTYPGLGASGPGDKAVPYPRVKADC